MAKKTKTPKTHWNYRIMAHRDHDEWFYLMHEVHYTKGVHRSHTVGGAVVCGHSIQELGEVMGRMIRAFSEPILSVEYWPEIHDPVKHKKPKKVETSIKIENGKAKRKK